MLNAKLGTEAATTTLFSFTLLRRKRTRRYGILESSNVHEAVFYARNFASMWMGQGVLADFIPRLADVDPDKLAVVVTDVDGNVYSAGDTDQRFTAQSIAKVILLAAALRDKGFEHVFQRVGMEPTGDPFNSIIRLETTVEKPFNPMINAGAIAVAACLPGASSSERFLRLLTYARELLCSPELVFDEAVFESEVLTGDRNRALAYMMSSIGSVFGDVEDHLSLYFKACALWVNCREISHLASVLACGGVSPVNGKRLIDSFHAKCICSLMATCGMYDASGEFALRVGIPAKSGVGGGIAGVVPGRMGVGTFSPLLDSRGNSICGIKAMECLSAELGLSIFAPLD